MNPPRVIAEIGCNHRGEFETAVEMIKIAAQFCKVDIVKFQKRHPRTLLSTAEYEAPHPNPVFAYGKTYGEHREFLEFTGEQHRRLKELAEEWGVTYSSSVWDLPSAREIAGLQPALVKVPSACNSKFDLLEYLAGEYGGEIHLSLGMTTRGEEEGIVQFFEEQKRASDLVLYSCTAGYPVAVEDICLLEISRLRETYSGRVKAIGFSGHHLGIAMDVAAVTLGAEFLERHFTLDRTWKGTDHAASLEPDGMRRITRDARNVTKALTFKSTEILPVEEAQRAKLKRA